jgi:hypothetical protein
MKKVCYLILAHRNLELVARTINRLRSSDACFMIHIDAKCHEELSIESNRNDVIICSERHNVVWGEISLVDAILSMCREAIINFPAHHYILISGNDYPTKRATQIEELLDKNIGCNFVAGERLPSSRLPWIEGGARRLNAYAITVAPHRIATIEPRKADIGNLRQLIKVIAFGPTKICAALKIFFTWKRRTPPTPIYGGSTWWIISHDTMKAILDYDNSHPEFHQFMTDTNNPDEVYIQTLVYNLAADATIKQIMRKISWNGHGNSPQWLTIDNRAEFSSAVADPNTLFIRKVGSEDVADQIDELIAKQ